MGFRNCNCHLSMLWDSVLYLPFEHVVGLSIMPCENVMGLSNCNCCHTINHAPKIIGGNKLILKFESISQSVTSCELKKATPLQVVLFGFIVG